MLDVGLLRAEPDHVRRALNKRGVQVDLDKFLDLDNEFRGVRIQIEQLRADRGKVSEQVAHLRQDAAESDKLRVEAQAIGTRLTELEARLAELESVRANFLDPLPNLPDDDVPPGGKENNEVIRVVGDKPDCDFPIKDHVQLAESLRLIDYQRGVKLGGNGFWVYRGDGAMLEWALLNYFVDAHRRAGYEFILPPHILGYQAGYVAGQFPRFAEDVFAVEPGGPGGAGPRRFLLPTSETALVNLHRDETFSDGDLPRKYFAYSPCYRKESGGYRSTERGTLRGHQFQKIEMFQFTRPDESDAAHEELLSQAEQLVAGLGLHYRITFLAAEDISAAMARTYDIEVWLPSVGAYLEVSSVSNARDYQARRGNIRYRNREGKSAFVHTLNASGLATSRLLPAILEQYQRADGSVVVPEVLREWAPGEVLLPSG